MARYAEDTKTSITQSRIEIENLLMRYGADQFISGSSLEASVVGFRLNGLQVKFHLPMPAADDKEITHYHHNSGRMLARTPEAARKKYDKACRSRWRALALVVKAKLEAVESGIAMFEEEFMAHIVLPDGGTVGQHMLPQIESAYESGSMPNLLPDFSGGAG